MTVEKNRSLGENSHISKNKYLGMTFQITKQPADLMNSCEDLTSFSNRKKKNFYTIFFFKTLYYSWCRIIINLTAKDKYRIQQQNEDNTRTAWYFKRKKEKKNRSAIRFWFLLQS